MLIGLVPSELHDPRGARRRNVLAGLLSVAVTLLPLRSPVPRVCAYASGVNWIEAAAAATARSPAAPGSSRAGLAATAVPADTPHVQMATVAEAETSGSAYDAFRGLTAAEIEIFLREARVVAIRDIGVGVTKPLRATLDDGRIRHDAAVQSADVCETTVAPEGGAPETTCDSYKYNVAAYEIGKLLGLITIPPSVEREFKGRRSAFTWWIDDALTLAEMEVRGLWQPNMAEWNREHPAVRVFDELILNTDRHMANLLQDPVWWVWMIDHTRAFGVRARLRDPELLSELPADSSLVARLLELDGAALQRCCARYLTTAERDGVLARRDSIVTRLSPRSAR